MNKNLTSSSAKLLDNFPLSEVVPGLSMQIFRTFEEAAEKWNQLSVNNLFLEEDYLKLLEAYSPQGMNFRYLVFSKGSEVAGVAYFQVQYFNADESINQPVEGNDPCFFKSVSKAFKEFISKRVEFNTLVCGNLLLTGEHGYHFNTEYISEDSQFEILTKAFDLTIQSLNDDGISVSVVFLKDYFQSTSDIAQNDYKQHRFHEFSFHPNMILKLRDDWDSFDDYLAAMYSKYRVRARRAAKKGKDILKRELSEADVQQYEERINFLYESVMNNAGFNTITLNDHYFLGLKKHLGDNFQIVGYFMNDELISFYTTIRNYDELEAHFMGFDQSINKEYQIYLNMLYDIVRRGIYVRAKEVVFARTALEIKSSVGAVAHEMNCYLRHQGKIASLFVKNLVNYLNAPEEWTPRHPFKPID